MGAKILRIECTLVDKENSHVKVSICLKSLFQTEIRKLTMLQGICLLETKFENQKKLDRL